MASSSRPTIPPTMPNIMLRGGAFDEAALAALTLVSTVCIAPEESVEIETLPTAESEEEGDEEVREEPEEIVDAVVVRPDEVPDVCEELVVDVPAVVDVASAVVYSR